MFRFPSEREVAAIIMGLNNMKAIGGRRGGTGGERPPLKVQKITPLLVDPLM